MVSMRARDGWRFVSIDSGAQCATADLIIVLRKWCADNWGTRKIVSWLRITWSLSVQCKYLTRTILSGVITNVFFGEADSEVPINLAEVDCYGTESDLLQCSYDLIGEHDCSHAEDVGIMCERQQGRVLLQLLHIYMATTCIIVVRGCLI